jgi:ABC-2 type transport system ATP-binding protein
LNIEEGDRVALIGSNGAGKTTLIRCLLGEHVHGGSVLFSGLSPRRERRKVLGQIGFVPQLPPPLGMPVGELFAFAAKVCGESRDEMESLCARLGMDPAEVKNKPFVKLSGGQKQKILVAIALARQTRLLVLDEPTANLDPAARQIVFDLLAERLNRAMIVSSHRLEEVAPLVNRVVEMDQGRIVLDDRIASDADPSSRQDCTLTLTRPEEAFARAITEWGFRGTGGGTQWKGQVAGPDRLRFLGMLSRYAGLLERMQLGPVAAKGATGGKGRRKSA